MLSFVNFKKAYGSVTVLTIDALSVDRGIFWIKGANGSGKSTLLQTAAGILDFNGDIRFDDLSVKHNPISYRQRVNFAEAEPIFPEFLTGQDLVKLFSSAKSAPKGQANYFVESMKMREYLNDPVGSYSTGMLKKLSIVLAFLGTPQLILLDEPLITIDKESLNVLHHLIEEKHRKDGVMFILSSHQTIDAGALPITGELIVENQTVKVVS